MISYFSPHESIRMGLSMRGISILFLFFHAKAYVNPLGAGNSCFSSFAYAFQNLQQAKKRRQTLLLLLCLRLPEPPARKKAQAMTKSAMLPTPTHKKIQRPYDRALIYETRIRRSHPSSLHSHLRSQHRKNPCLYEASDFEYLKPPEEAPPPPQSARQHFPQSN